MPARVLLLSQVVLHHLRVVSSHTLPASNIQSSPVVLLHLIGIRCDNEPWAVVDLASLNRHLALILLLLSQL